MSVLIFSVCTGGCSPFDAMMGNLKETKYLRYELRAIEEILLGIYGQEFGDMREGTGSPSVNYGNLRKAVFLIQVGRC